MRLRDGLKIVWDAGLKVGQVAADVAMTQPRIRERVERVQAAVDIVRREVEEVLAQAEARAQVLLKELQDEALRTRRQLERQRSASENYQTLGLQNGASLDDVKKAYRKAMRKHHPDKHSLDAAAEAQANERAQRINAAYRDLTALLTGKEGRAVS